MEPGAVAQNYRPPTMQQRLHLEGRPVDEGFRQNPMGEFKDWLVPLLTFLGTVFAGAGLKWAEGWLKKAKDKDDTATTLRNELRGEFTSLKAEMLAIVKETDLWREKYYIEKENCMKLEIELDQIRWEIQQKGQ